MKVKDIFYSQKHINIIVKCSNYKSKNYHNYSHMTSSNNTLPLHVRDRKTVTVLRWREALKREAQGLANFFIKGQTVNILAFASYFSVLQILYCCSMKTGKLYL